MKKLELKHLAPYLPYALKVFRHTGETTDMLELTAGKIQLWEDDYYQVFKPVLRPIPYLNTGELKEIVKHLFKDSHMIRPCYDDRHPITCNDGYISFYDDSTMQTYVAVKPSAGTGLPVLNMSNHFSDYDVFFKLHIDLFGLINAGLAIDINTITT
jgi:hypothetical protein